MPYLHRMWDNNSGNRSGIPPPVSYCTFFRDLGGVYDRKLDVKLTKKESASALWCLQMAHQTKIFPTTDGRLYVTDNFYTRHVFAKQLLLFTDGEAEMLVPIRMKTVDGVNIVGIKYGIKILGHSERGSWLLVHVLDKCVGSGTESQRADNFAYILFKDRKVVTFYTNNLAATTRQEVEGLSEHTLTCVHGEVPLQIWLGTESITRTKLHVPAPVVAYNLFINSVDRFDQYRSTNSIMRRDKRVPMSIFTNLLDASMQNSFTILHNITIPGSVNYAMREFKRRVASQMVEPLLDLGMRNISLKTERLLLSVMSTVMGMTMRIIMETWKSMYFLKI